jgi:tripartite-type tricarboxylate transporter receptor subunit TctC
MKLLAVSSEKRSASAPDVPTVAEALNAPGFDITLWVGFFAPRGTPKEIVTHLNEEINKILLSADIKDRLLSEGADVTPMSVDQFSNFVKTESEKYAEIAKQTGMKAE